MLTNIGVIVIVSDIVIIVVLAVVIKNFFATSCLLFSSMSVFCSPIVSVVDNVAAIADSLGCNAVDVIVVGGDGSGSNVKVVVDVGRVHGNL